jgi:hypothetical protein
MKLFNYLPNIELGDIIFDRVFCTFWLTGIWKGKKFILNFLNFLVPKLNFLVPNEILKKKIEKNCFAVIISRDRLDRSSWGQRKGARKHRGEQFICWMLKIRSELHVIWSTLKSVSRDYLGQFCITCKSALREPILNIQLMNCSPQLVHYSRSQFFHAIMSSTRSVQPFSSYGNFSETSRVHLISKFLVKTLKNHNNRERELYLFRNLGMRKSVFCM